MADGRQIAKAEELLRQGDVSGARLLLEHASRQGSAVASFKLAETYDPDNAFHFAQAIQA